MRTFRVMVLPALLLGFQPAAWATDQIICDSASFKASFAVGSDGYVTRMDVADKSKRYFPDVLQITDMAPQHRRVSIPGRSVDVSAAPGKPGAKTVVVRIRKGHGYIEVDSRREAATCDWVI